MKYGDRVEIRNPKSKLNGLTGEVISTDLRRDIVVVLIDAKWLSGGHRGRQRQYTFKPRDVVLLEEGPGGQDPAHS